MILAIIGSRTFDDYKLLDDTVEEYFCDYVDYIRDGYIPKFSKFVSGGAEGADTLGKKWVDNYNNSIDPETVGAELYGYSLIEIEVIKPEWDKYGKRAAFIRNEKIIMLADVVLAFWDGQSNGTRDALKWAKKYKKPSLVVYF
jgi:hypothetical protein